MQRNACVVTLNLICSSSASLYRRLRCALGFHLRRVLLHCDYGEGACTRGSAGLVSSAEVACVLANGRRTHEGSEQRLTFSVSARHCCQKGHLCLQKDHASIDPTRTREQGVRARPHNALWPWRLAGSVRASAQSSSPVSIAESGPLSSWIPYWTVHMMANRLLILCYCCTCDFIGLL